MAGYRNTLNLPKTDFPMKADLARREPDRLQWWKERGSYARLRAIRREAAAPVWLLHDGPPYSNAHLHMGTAANKIWKDAAVRQASLLGFDAPYVPGWDNHGMPIEMQVGKDFEKLKQKPDRLTLRRGCRAYAEKWVAIQREEFERLGGWGEWEHPYLTMDPGFEAEILETFAALVARGFVQRGKRSIHWCPTDRTALAMAEIEYQDIESPSIFVLFPLRKDPAGVLSVWPEVAAVAWTTTPWTLPANLGLMVDPDAEYVVARMDGKPLLLARARLQALAERLNRGQPTVEATFSGRKLLGLVFEAPFGNDSRMVDGTPYVSMEDGTGIVHTAPGHGTEDFLVGQREGLGVVSPVDEAGRYTSDVAGFAGRKVLEVDADLIVWLDEKSRLLLGGSLRHSYPHCWRCRRPVIFRATDQWFMIVDHRGHRERCLAAIDNQVRWDPESSQNRIREAVRARPDWCLSRQRNWGVGIPAIYCETCGQPDLDQAVMRRAAQLTREHSSDVWYERPVEDFVPEGYRCPHCDATGPFRKETDVLDVWFDSGSTHRAVQVTHPQLKEDWARARHEGDVLYFEGPDQHRGWFNSSLMVGVGVDDTPPYTKVATHGWVLDGQGLAMHKSLGNVISPITLIGVHGADVVRWWALATDWRTDVRVSDEILQRVAEAYRKVRNTFRFLLGNLSDFNRPDIVARADLAPVDRAFLDCLCGELGLVRQSWEDLRFHRALDQLLRLCTVDLSAVFLDAAKDRLYTLAPDARARRSAQTVLWHALHDVALAVSPGLVFTAEEVWQHHPDLVEESESVHLGQWPSAEDSGSRDEWDSLLRLRDSVYARIEPLRAAKELTTTTEADVVVTAAPATAEHFREYQTGDDGDELASFLMVARLTIRDGAPSAGEDFQVEATRTRFLKCERCWTYRSDVSGESKSALCARCAGVLAVTGRKAS